MKKLREITVALIEIAALAALSYGCFLAWKPAGFIVPGALVFGLSIVADIRRDRGKEGS